MTQTMPLLACACLLLAACGPSSTPVASTPPPATPDGVWHLVRFNDQPAAQPPIELRLDTAAGAIGGFGGVNRYRGMAALEEGRLMVQGVISTKMAGPRMDEEDRFFRLLQSNPRIEWQGTHLILHDDQTNLRAEFQPAPATEKP